MKEQSESKHPRTREDRPASLSPCCRGSRVALGRLENSLEDLRLQVERSRHAVKMNCQGMQFALRLVEHKLEMVELELEGIKAVDDGKER